MKVKKCSKLIIGAVTSAAIATTIGCSNEPEFIEKECTERIDTKALQGNSAVSIKNFLTEEDLLYANFLCELADTVFIDSNVANSFAENPVGYITNAGYGNWGFEFDEEHLTLISAIADSEIRSAIEAADLSLFMSLCKNKGYIKNYSQNLIALYNSLNNDSMFLLTASNEQLKEALVLPVVLLAVAWTHVIYKLVLLTKNGIRVSGSEDFVSELFENKALELLLLSSEERMAFLACEEYITNEVNIVMQHVRTENPNLSPEADQELTNFLKKNIIHLSNLEIEP